MQSLRKILSMFSRKKIEQPRRVSRERAVAEAVRSIIVPAEPIQVARRDPSWRIIESYYIYKPFVKVVIAETPEGPMYFVEEYGLTPSDKEVLEKLTEILMDEIRPPTRPEDIKDLKGYVFRETERIAEKYKEKLGLVGARKIKLLYYIERNLLGYGPIDPLMKDTNIEDISCNGVNIPIYVWHKKYESIPTNITFIDEDYLNEFIMKMAHMAGKHISIAFPILDAMLPEKHRLAATFGREVSVKGPTFTIRKFRERPFSVTEIIQSGVINSLIAAYLWTLMEHGKTAMIAGGTGVGKSFPGHAKLVAKIKNKPLIIEAEKLYDLVDSDEYIIGEHIVKDVDDEIRVLSLDKKDYSLKWKKLLRVIKHRDRRPLVKIHTSSSIITTTIDHNFIRIDPETLELKPVKAEELRIGDYIVNVWLDTDYHVEDNIGIDKAFFLGLWIGNGYLDKYNHSIVYTTRDKELLKHYTSLVKRLFRRETHVKTDKRNNVYSIVFSHSILYNELRKLYTNNKSYEVRVPDSILFARDKSIILSFLAGLLESNGSIYIVRNKDSRTKLVVEYGSRSLELINGISFLLKRLRIGHVVEKKIVKDKDYYRIFIFGHKALRLLDLLYGFLVTSNSKKIYLLARELYRDKTRNTLTEIYPINEFLMSIRNKLGLGHETVEEKLGLPSRYLRQYESARRILDTSVVDKLISYYEDIARRQGNIEVLNMIRRLRRLLDSDVYFEKILRIEYVEPTNNYLYDIEVEDTHTFVIGEIGWRLNHNTTMLNVVSMFIRPGMKIVTIEDTPEINLPHPNWVQLTSRETYLVGTSALGTNIRLFDLVKLSLRYRPDYIIVGEVRGEEAFVLFQAMASVAHDTPVLIRDPGGKVSLTKIGEFIDKFYKEGEERIPKYINGYYVLSNEGYNAVWKPIKYVLRHSIREIYEIEYEGGGRLEATGNHSVFVLDPDTLDIVEKPVILLNRGEYLVSFKGVDEAKEYKVIDLTKLLKDTDDIIVDKLPRELKKLTNNKNPIPLQQYLLIKDRAKQSNNVVILRLRRSKYALPSKLVLDEELAFIFGAYIANGCIRENNGKHICFTLSKRGKEIAEKILDIIYGKFGIKPIINYRGTYTVYEYPHTLLATIFEKLLGRKLGEKKIPDILWDSPKSVIRAFFEGLRIGSCRALKEKYASYTTTNKTLAYQLLWLARLAGYYSELMSEEDRRVDKNKIYYKVLIYPSEDHEGPDASERIPVKPILKLIEFTQPKPMPPELTYIRRREFVSKKTAEKVIQWIKEKGAFTDFSKEYLNKIEKLINSNIVIVEVKDIRKKPYHGYVYDISVPGTESFFGGNIPILLHNTGHGGLCLPRDQTVLVKVNGKYGLYRIGDVVEGVINGIVKRAEVLTYKNGKPVWVPVKRVIVKNGSSRFVRIHAEGGVVHEVHENHPVIVYINGELKTKPAKELKRGDIIVSVKELPVEETIRKINVIDYMKEFINEIYVENADQLLQGIPRQIILSTINGIRTKYVVDDWKYGDVSIPLNILLKLKPSLEKYASSLRIKYGEKARSSIPMEIKLDKDFGFIIGLFLADGTINYDNKDGLPRRIVFYLRKNRQLYKKLISKLRSIGIEEHSIKTRYYDNTIWVVVNSKIFALLIYKLLEGKVTDHDRVPPLDIVLRSPRGFREGIIEGYWLGDGNISIDKEGHLRIQASTVNKLLSESIILILKTLGVLASLKEVDNSRGFGRDRRSIYRIIVLGGESKKRFLEIMGMNKDISKTYTKIRQQDNLLLHRVVNIEIITKDSLLYDIEVPDTHLFAISGGLILTHNSTIHAETLDYAIKRLMSPPMNIPSTYMNLLNVFIHMKRVITRIERGVVRVQRRVTIVQEIEEFGKYRTIAIWDPRTDKFKVNLEESIHLRDIADKRGLELEDIIDEIYRKATVLNWMLYKNILNVWDVSRIIFNYYYDPATVYKRAVRELEEAGREVVPPTAAAPEEVASTEELVGGTKEMGEATKELFERTRELGK